MKKILSVLILGALLLFTALPAIAGAIAGEFMLFGSWDMERGKHSLDGGASQFTFSLYYPLHQFMFGAEVGAGSLKPATDFGDKNDFNLLKLKGGYYLINNRLTQLAATFGFSKINLADPEQAISGWMLGLDLLTVLNAQLDLEAALAFSLTGDYEYTSLKKSFHRDCSILDWKIKLIYYLQKNLAATAGYSYSASTIDLPGDPRYTLSGVSLGLKYHF